MTEFAEHRASLRGPVHGVCYGGLAGMLAVATIENDFLLG